MVIERVPMMAAVLSVGFGWFPAGRDENRMESGRKTIRKGRATKESAAGTTGFAA
jgi:hypothetical protein